MWLKNAPALLLAMAVSMAGGVLSPASVAAQVNPDNHLVSRTISPQDWFSAGGDPTEYAMGMDSAVQLDGKDSGFVKSRYPAAKGFGTLMQVFDATPYRGKRVRMTGFVKTRNVRGWAALWMRADSPNAHTGTYGSMEKNPIRGTRDWKAYEVVVDVPNDCELISLALVLTGHGQAWINNIKLQEIR